MNVKGTPAVPGARLRAEFERLKSADPFQVLGIGPSSEAAAIRWAFLELTKRYHPNRFAREAGEVRDLANELFLLIRRAYAILADEHKRKVWRDRVGSGTTVAPTTQTPPIVVPSSAAPAPPVVVAPVAPIPPQVDTTEKRRLFDEATRLAEKGNWAEARKIYDRISRGTIPPAAEPKVAVPPRPSTPPPRRTGTPSGGFSVPPMPSRAATPAPNPTPPGGVTFKKSPTTPPQGLSVRPDVNAVLEQVRTRGQRFEDAQRRLAQGDFREAREAFHKIATEDPQTKKYRVYLYYAWGLEHRAAGRIDEALKELERSLALDPSMDEVRRDLEKTKELKKGGGLFGKFFGR